MFVSLSAAEAATNLRDSAAARFQPSAYSAQLSEVSPKLLRKMQRSHGEKTYPGTVAPDMLSQNPKPMVFETVQEKKVITDGTKTMELYHLQNSGHNVATLIVYLPKEGLLYYGDGYNPPPGDNPIDPARTPEYGIDLYRNITLLNLNVKTIAPAHSTRAVPYDNLKKAIGLLSVAAN